MPSPLTPAIDALAELESMLDANEKAPVNLPEDGAEHKAPNHHAVCPACGSTRLHGSSHQYTEGNFQYFAECLDCSWFWEGFDGAPSPFTQPLPLTA